MTLSGLPGRASWVSRVYCRNAGASLLCPCSKAWLSRCYARGSSASPSAPPHSPTASWRHASPGSAAGAGCALLCTASPGRSIGCTWPERGPGGWHKGGWGGEAETRGESGSGSGSGSGREGGSGGEGEGEGEEWSDALRERLPLHPSSALPPPAPSSDAVSARREASSSDALPAQEPLRPPGHPQPPMRRSPAATAAAAEAGARLTLLVPRV